MTIKIVIISYIHMKMMTQTILIEGADPKGQKIKKLWSKK